MAWKSAAQRYAFSRIPYPDSVLDDIQDRYALSGIPYGDPADTSAQVDVFETVVYATPTWQALESSQAVAGSMEAGVEEFTMAFMGAVNLVLDRHVECRLLAPSIDLSVKNPHIDISAHFPSVDLVT